MRHGEVLSNFPWGHLLPHMRTSPVKEHEMRVGPGEGDGADRGCYFQDKNEVRGKDGVLEPILEPVRGVAPQLRSWGPASTSDSSFGSCF